MCGLLADRQHPLQLAAGDDVEPGALTVYQPQDGKRWVGLDRITDKRTKRIEGPGEDFYPMGNLIARIYIQWSAMPSRHFLERYWAAVEGRAASDCGKRMRNSLPPVKQVVHSTRTLSNG